MPWFAAQADEVRQSREQLRQIQSEIGATERLINKAQDVKLDLQTELREAEKKISRIGRRLHAIRQDYRIQQQRHDELEEVVAQREVELRIEQDRLARLLRSAFQVSRHGELRMLLNQQDPAQISRVLTYHEYFNQQRIRQIEAVRYRLDKMRLAEQSLALQTRTLQRLQERRQQELSRLEKFKVEREVALATITLDIGAQGAQLEQLRKNEKELQGVLNELTESLSDIASLEDVSFSRLKGKLPWPSQGRLLVRFNDERGDSGKNWTGVVIGADRGTDVRAVARGRVAFSDWLRGYGLLIIIDHGDDYMSLYGHNESVFKDTGEWVEAGDVVASVGDSGGQQRPGLYFEIRSKGKPVNPVQWVASGRRGKGA